MLKTSPWFYSDPGSSTQTISLPPLLLILIPALVGMSFCLANAFGADLLCLTRGCSLYAGYSLFGISVDLLGAGAFLAIVTVALLARKHKLWRLPLYLLLVFGLLFDALFLFWQILFWPCTSCLFIALVFLLCLLGALRAFPLFHSKFLYLTLLLWLVTFMPAAANAGKELLLRPWAVFGSVDAPVAVYFSPTCPACRTSVLAVLDTPMMRGQAAYFPVAKSDEDLQRLAAMVQVGGEAGLRQLFAQENPELQKVSWSLRWRLARNSMLMARMGVDTVPLILTPQIVAPAPSPPVLPAPSGHWLPQNFFAPPALEAGCSLAAGAEEPCD